MLSRLAAKLSALRSNANNHSIKDQFCLSTYSQEGEDRILYRFFEDEAKQGFYVDVGAHHPYRFSNTQLFYEMGWRGINIDPNPEAISLFKQYRKDDINLNVGVGRENSMRQYFSFEESAYNTFDQDLAKTRPSKIIGISNVKIRPLNAILSAHISCNQTIDFLSVDAEGLDIEVLESNDWSKFRPTLVIVEILLAKDIIDVLNSDLIQFMRKNDYRMYGRCINSVILLRNS